MKKIILSLVFTVITIYPLYSADVKIGKNKEFIVNGKPFFPLAVTTQPTLTMDLHKTLGINLISGGPDAKGEDPEYWMDTCFSKGFLGDMGIPINNYEEMKKWKDHPALFCWWMPDEPDNAGKEKAPKHEPSEIMEIYKKAKAMDPNHPVGLCFGSGSSSGSPPCASKYYPEFAKAADYTIFDVYPCNRGWFDRLHYYVKGLGQLFRWDGPNKKPHGVAVEASFLGAEGGRNASGTRAPKPSELRAEVWMCIVHGTHAIYYFTHSWSPGYHWARIPDDLQAEMKKINKQVTDLTPVILSEDSKIEVTTEKKDGDANVDTLVKEGNGKLYIFSSNIRSKAGTTEFTIKGVLKGEIEVYEEGRKLQINNGKFIDKFNEFEPHIYIINK